MRMLFHAILAGMIALSGSALAQDLALHFAMDGKVLTPPPGLQVLATVGQNDNAAEISARRPVLRPAWHPL